MVMVAITVVAVDAVVVVVVMVVFLMKVMLVAAVAAVPDKDSLGPLGTVILAPPPILCKGIKNLKYAENVLFVKKKGTL
jgi:hypothetical protein